MTYLLFAFLTYVAYYMVYFVRVGDYIWFREDAHILLWVSAAVVGGAPLLAFCTLTYIACYSVERMRKKYRYRPLNLLLLVIQAFVIAFVFRYLDSLFTFQRPLTLALTIFITLFMAQVITLFVTAFLYAFPWRTTGWKRELLKYNLMDSIYLSLYVIISSHLEHMEPNAVLQDLTKLFLLVAIVGLYYWRTVGIKQTGRVNQQYDELQVLNARLTYANQQVLLAFASSLEKRDPYTAGHSERVAEYAVAIAAELGHSEEDLQLIRLGGLLHDIGKIGIPDEVLNKPGKLTAEEYDIMKQHPVMGEDLLRRVYTHSNLLSDEERERMLEIVLYHHERPDGRGYPQGLKGDEIPPFARLTAVADAFDAMTSNRAYREALTVEQASEILRGGCGTQFWTPAVNAFLRVLAAWDYSVESHMTYAEVASAAQTTGRPPQETDTTKGT
jgi:putative nucleotidyltransferase with HDIG domain